MRLFGCMIVAEGWYKRLGILLNTDLIYILLCIALSVTGFFLLPSSIERYKNSRKPDFDLLDEALDGDDFCDSVEEFDREYTIKKSKALQGLTACIFLIAMGIICVFGILFGTSE